MRRLLALIASGLFGISSPVWADSPVVVELYTSQGCSSCPPADAYLAQLAGNDDVIALALHVDYWDYIGWKDSFAQAQFTTRQKAYAHVAGARSIYTPQIIVQGVDHVVGNHPKDVEMLIKRHGKVDAPVELNVERDGNTIKVTAQAETALPDPVLVQLVRYEPEETVKIRAGENAGRNISYANIVTQWVGLGEWDTRRPLAMKADVEGDAPIVVIVQHPGPGGILATARLR